MRKNLPHIVTLTSHPSLTAFICKCASWFPHDVYIIPFSRRYIISFATRYIISFAIRYIISF